MTVSNFCEPSTSTLPSTTEVNRRAGSKGEALYSRVSSVYREHRSFLLHNTQISSLAFCRDGEIISASGYNVKLWNPDTDSLRVFINPSDTLLKARVRVENTKIVHVREMPDGNILTIAHSNRKRKANHGETSRPNHSDVHITDRSTGEFKTGLKESRSQRNYATPNNKFMKIYEVVELSPHSQERQFATISSASNSIQLWDFRDKVMGRGSKIEGHLSKITAMCLLSDMKILTASLDNTLKIWDVSTKKCLENYKSDQSQIMYVSEFKDKRFIAISKDGALKIWIRNQEPCAQSFKINAEKLVFSLLLGCENILIINNLGIAEIWDPNTEHRVQEWNNNKYTCAAENVYGQIALGDQIGQITLFYPVELEGQKPVVEGVAQEKDEPIPSTSAEISNKKELIRNINALVEETFGIDDQVQSAMRQRDQDLKEELQRAHLTVKEIKKFEKRPGADKEKTDTFIQREITSLDAEFEKIKVSKEKVDTGLIAILKELQESKENKAEFTGALKQQQSLFEKQSQMFELELMSLRSQQVLLTDQQKTQDEKLKPLIEKYQKKEKLLEEQNKLLSSPTLSAFYKTLEQELGKKMQASILLTSGLLQRSAVKKDLLSDAAAFAVEGVFAFFAGMISVGTLGASTLVVGAAAAVVGAGAGKAAGKLVSDRIDKKYERRAQEISASMSNPKYAWAIAELVARRVTHRYKSDLRKNSPEANQEWGKKTADILYLFIASGKLKEKGYTTEDQMIGELISEIERYMAQKNTKKSSKKNCTIL